MEVNAADFITSTYSKPRDGSWTYPCQLGVRITHISGVYAESDTERSQHANREIAFQMIREKLAKVRTSRNRVSVDQAALAMVIQALRRDAAEGRLVRGEMADILEESAVEVK